MPVPAAPRHRRSAAVHVLAVCLLVALLTACLPGGSDKTGAAPVDGPRAPTASAATLPSPGAVPEPALAARSRALAVLSDWDRRRARAYASGDVAGLRRLYEAGSALAEQDVRVLRRYGERGLRVTGLQLQVVSIEVRATSARAMTLSVVERLARAGVRPVASRNKSTGAASLPASQFARRLLRFEHVDGAWLLSWARAA